MAQSNKFADDIMMEARRKSELRSRSLSGWIGKPIEQSGAFSHDRIDAVLAGKASTTTLSTEEYAVWSDRFDELLASLTPQAEAFFAERRRLGLGSGLDANGNLVHASDLLAKRDS